MSSSGRMRAITPLFPCRPAILSPTESLRFMAINTLTILMTPGASSSPCRSLAIFFFLLDGQRTLVLFLSFAGEYLNIYNRAVDAGRRNQRSVFNVARFLTEDRAQKFLFGG